MEEEEVNKILLSGLGVTSANPEDIERDLIAEANRKVGNDNVVDENIDAEHCDKAKKGQPSSSVKEVLYNKLRAVELEIDAVASTIGPVRDGKGSAPSISDHCTKEDAIDDLGTPLPLASDLNIQQALAADRLSSLKKTRFQLQKELSDVCEDYSAKGIEYDVVLQSLVREEKKPKQRFLEVQRPKKNSNKQQRKVSLAEDTGFDSVLDAAAAGFVETERDELVRKGILTPFHKVKGFERRIEQPLSSNRQDVVLEDDEIGHTASDSIARAAKSMSEAAKARPTTKLLNVEDAPKLEPPTHSFRRLKKPLESPQSIESDGVSKKTKKRNKKRPSPAKKWRKLSSQEFSKESDELIGDGEDGQKYLHVEDEETHFVMLEGGLKIPEAIFENLFDYQKVGVQWLWELHCQRAGGIIGDEMGLGKTIQVLSFLGALHFSGMYKPSIIVCPVTLLRQWKREANKWYEGFRVEILHDSAQVPCSMTKPAKSHESDYESEGSLNSDVEEKPPTKNAKKWDILISKVVNSESGLLITTYEQLRLLGDKLLEVEWGYAVLDEGHRIRNPNADITLICKQLQTVHRIIMSGAPIQNKLTELWSLFDFVFPGKLGVLPVFEAEFSVPISVGGYANASPFQVSTAYRCAVVLRDLIMPYLLRRVKTDVHLQLPKKTEHVLFCSLTAVQRSTYRAFLASTEVEQIFDGNRNSLYGIDVMRKICNHPDLLEREHAFNNPDYGNPERSGKMKVIVQVLKMWKEQDHRVLLFTQTQQMLDIIVNFLSAAGYSYLRMDGATPVKQRMALIDDFNNSSDVFIFILTTKVGGLGTNLTGANRVIIFDPDWNPSTDMQARERAWRIGQKRDVVVYRLITRGTIEEKVYHRQIYKHFLTNKILKNPQQRRFFKARDMRDLFTLTDDNESCSTETSNIFSQLADDATVVGTRNHIQHKQKTGMGANEAAINTVNSKAVPSQTKGKEKVDQTDDPTDEETDFLKSLFDAHGIHSAINHDTIMNAHDSEKLWLQEQATQVAQRAAEALRHSRMLRSQESISVPTWTGKSGLAGAPPTVRRKFGSTVNSQVTNSGTRKPDGFAGGKVALSSADLLTKIRGNQERAVGDGLDHQFNLSTSSSGRGAKSVPPEVLARQICSFLQGRGGTGSSGSIVEHFKDRIPSNDLPLFKNLLKEIAALQKGSTGSLWVLKPEYQLQ